VLLALLSLQFVSGAFLGLYYVASPRESFERLSLLTEKFSSLQLLHSLHSWGTSFLVVVAALHLFRVVVDGAYQRPRELNWVSGALLMIVLFGFAATGFLLPWNQEGYWSTVVGIQMLDSLPWAGPVLARLLAGGSEVDAATLSRFFALHTLFLPAVCLLLILAHLTLLRVHGVTPPIRSAAASTRRLSFYPYQVFRDSMATLATLFVLAVVSLLAPVQLSVKANMGQSTFDPRPVWFLLPHYELIRSFPGPSWVPGVALPLLALAIIMTLPFLARSGGAHWKTRLPAVVGVALSLALMLLTVAYSRIQHPAQVGESVTVHPDQLPQRKPESPAAARGPQLFVEEKCVNCHQLGGLGGRLGPDLSDAGSRLDRETLSERIVDPKRSNRATQMPSYKSLSRDDLKSLLEYLMEVAVSPSPSTTEIP
jgi:ubiquinol-cytochrome c reductase cytochrome b subunit